LGLKLDWGMETNSRISTPGPMTRLAAILIRGTDEGGAVFAMVSWAALARARGRGHAVAAPGRPLEGATE